VPLTARQKIVLAIVFLALVALGYVFWEFFRPLLREYAITRADVLEAAREVESQRVEFSYYENPDDYLEKIQPELAKWENAYKGREKVFATILRKIPPGEQTPEFYFHEEWKATRDRLIEKARQQNVAIPPDIGFSSAIPPRDQVETLLNQLSATEYVLNMALDNGVLQITNFTVGAPIEKSGFVRLLPFQIGFIASMENVKKFLYWCGYGPQYVKVEYVSLSAIREGLIARNFQANVILTTTWILDKPAVTVAEEAEAVPGMPTGWAELLRQRGGIGGRGDRED
jgi:hypothetical protein